MTRIPDHVLTLARAKAALLTQGAAPRIAARQGRGLTAGHLDAIPELTVIALADPDTREKVVSFAAAAAHGSYIAGAISGTAREELAKTLSDDARRFALQHRGLAYAASVDFESDFTATRMAMEEHLIDALKCAPTDDPQPRACIEAAIEGGL